MLYFSRLLFVLINIDQETILNWFGIGSPNHDLTVKSLDLTNYNPELPETINQSSAKISLATLGLIIENLWLKINDGLTLNDIESCLVFILLLRFIVLGIRYNLKTSFYIVCIGFVAGYLWYRHLIDLISMYRNKLLNVPFLENLGMDALQLREYHYQIAVSNKRLGENIHWYDFGPLIYYSFVRGIIDVDPNTGLRSYIDPISMIISTLDESTQSTVVPFYYKLYNQILPKIFMTCSNFWAQFSGIAAYGLVTRIGKRYCPYLIRWHWTLLLVVSIIEPFIEYFVFRAEFFKEFILVPRLVLTNSQSTVEEVTNALQVASYYSVKVPEMNLENYNQIFLQILGLNIFVNSIIIIHVGLILLALFHAVWGQYFYLPFFTENVELHIGPRPQNSIYSGGNTSWQDPREKEKNFNRLFPKMWYGWLGRGTKNSRTLGNVIKMFIVNIFITLKELFKR
jgi:hypothetical protein